MKKIIVTETTAQVVYKIFDTETNTTSGKTPVTIEVEEVNAFSSVPVKVEQGRLQLQGQLDAQVKAEAAVAKAADTPNRKARRSAKSSKVLKVLKS